MYKPTEVQKLRRNASLQSLARATATDARRSRRTFLRLCEEASSGQGVSLDQYRDRQTRMHASHEAMLRLEAVAGHVGRLAKIPYEPEPAGAWSVG